QTELVNKDEAVRMYREDPEKRIYTVSENSIEWVIRNMGFSDLPDKIDIFKNKVRFRDMTRELFPGLFYKEISVKELEIIDVKELPFPLILKPSVGFFSMGVKKINSSEEWAKSVSTLISEMNSLRDIYPDEVLNIRKFIIEEFIRGDEYAIDAYFNGEGEPVILGILKHVFSSEDDVGDRLYMSSKKIILDNRDQFGEFLKRVGKLAGLKNFPLHVEVRKSNSGDVVPIEINPLRFGAWCTTADATSFSFQMNPYEYYFSDRKPDWENILKDKDGKIFSMIVLDNTTGMKADQIKNFDHNGLLLNFDKINEFREIDHKKYNVFGFLFAETNDSDVSELDWILNNDLKEFIS
ncbi:MAG: ATP-grasp domain-containing protein, partial [Candidatus Aminicenantes bacterium]|nr:ATP-grasp domain-containing protein [Candidatus Aminicenantes bacterium]